MSLMRYALEKQTTASRSYELGLILKYNKYTLERARMGRYAQKIAWPRLSLSLKLQATGTRSITNIIAMMSHLEIDVLNCQI